MGEEIVKKLRFRTIDGVTIYESLPFGLTRWWGTTTVHGRASRILVAE